jgi:hypothetical protein
MVDQYKLRLGDGTVLAVDEQGLRTWLLDGKAMVQRPGSQAWRPLKEIVAGLSRESGAAAKPQSAPAPSVPVPALPLVQPAAQPPAPRPVPPPLLSAGRVATAPLADSIAKPGPKIDDGIPIIPFKRLDDDNAPRPATVPSGDLRDVATAALDPDGRNDGPWQWPGTKPRAEAGPADVVDVPTPVARSTAKPAGVPVRLGPIDPRAIVYPPVPGELAVRATLAWGARLWSRARQQLARLPPPPVPRMDTPLASPVARRRVKRAVVLAVSGAAVIVLGLSLWAWWPRMRATDVRSAGKTASPFLPAPLPAEKAPELPKEVQEAMAQLPHLAPDTIQLVMASGAASDAPELFRRASVAASRGSSALTDEEARELRGLMNGVLANLRRVDRERVRAYGRLSSQRDLLVEEDRKVLSLFARGVRALSPAHRERLQELSGKAIAAGLPARTPAPGTASVP